MTALLLPCCYPAAALLLPDCYQTATRLLPVYCLSVCCTATVSILPVCYPSIALLLPDCYLPVAFCDVFVEIFNKILGKQEKFVSL